MTNKKAEYIFSANAHIRLAGQTAPTKIEERNAYEKMKQMKLEIDLESVVIKKKPLAPGVYPKPDESAHVSVEIELQKEPQKNENVVSSEHTEIRMEQPFSTEDSFEEKASDKESIILEEHNPRFDDTAMNENSVQDEVERESQDTISPGKRTKVPWDNMFARLKEYGEEHGNTNVPQRQDSLGRWVNNQRAFFRRLEKGIEKPPLGTVSVVEWKEKIEMRKDVLDKLGFGMSHLLICLFVLRLRAVLNVGVSFASCYICVCVCDYRMAPSTRDKME
jgi:hypothetical protein